MKDIASQLRSIIEGEVESDEKVLLEHSRDASLFEVKPRLVVYPKNTDDLKKLVDFARSYPQEHLSLTCRSAGTDMTGGPLNDSIIVDMSRHFTGIGPIASGGAEVQPGAFYRDFERETLRHNLLLPSYPASRELCTVGGMVCNNSGGEKSLRYGKTERYVEQLKVVLADGQEHTIKPLSKAELDEKLKEQGMEGNLYRTLHGLLEKHYDRIHKAKPNVSKNSAGYSLWNVWDRNTFDLTQLFVGSQGTLGIVSDITFRLVTPNPYSTLLVIFLKDIGQLRTLIGKVLESRPESFESYDDHTLKFALRYAGEFLTLLGAKNLFSLLFQFIPEFWMLARGGMPKLILLAEFTGATKEETIDKAHRACRALKEFSVATRVAADPGEIKKYFVIRRESFTLLRRHAKGTRTAPFIDDFIVRPESLPEFLPKLEALLKEYPALLYTIAGHMGDGNFHIIPLMNLADPDSKKIIAELSEKVYDLVLSCGGSITAEHNDGLIRTPYLERMYGTEMTKIFSEVKNIFDPDRIFNPRKKTGGDLRYGLSHIALHN